MLQFVEIKVILCITATESNNSHYMGVTLEHLDNFFITLFLL